MAENTIHTRIYSERSAGKLGSAEKPRGDAFTHSEFPKHANVKSIVPTAFDLRE